MKPQTALVTGGYGYIGGYLVDFLLSKGWKVRVLDTLFSAKRTAFGSPQVSTSNASVSNVDAVSRAMQGVSVVFHLADRHDTSNASRHLLRLAKTNIEGTATVLTAAHNAGVNNVVFTSSFAVYGELSGGMEIDPLGPVSMHGATKAAAEALCQCYSALGTDVKILRLFSVWGRELSDSIVNKFAAGHNVIWGDGEQTRDFIFIDDVVNALYNAIVWDAGVYNLGTGVETTLRGLYSLINGSQEPELAEQTPVEIYRAVADTSSTQDRTKWQAKVLMSELTREEVIAKCLLK